MTLRRSAVFLAVLGSLTVLSRVRAGDLLALVPSDAEAVAHVNVRQLLESPLGKKCGVPLLQAQFKKMSLPDVLAGMEADPLRDAERLVVAFRGDGDRVLALVVGKFDPEGVKKAAGQCWSARARGQELHLGFVDGQTLAVATHREYVLSAQKGGDGGKLDERLQSSLAKINRQCHLWLTSLMPEKTAGLVSKSTGQAAPGALSKVRVLTAAVTATTVLNVALQARTADAQSARELTEFVSATVKLLRLALGSNAEYGATINDIGRTLVVKTNQDTVTATFKINEASLEKLLKTVK